MFLELDVMDVLIVGKLGWEMEVFVKGIVVEVSEKDVYVVLWECGVESGVMGFELVMDRMTGTYCGYAFARYDSRESAVNVVVVIVKVECEVKKMKIMVSVKLSKYWVMVIGL